MESAFTRIANAWDFRFHLAGEGTRDDGTDWICITSWPFFNPGACAVGVAADRSLENYCNLRIKKLVCQKGTLRCDSVSH